MPTSHQPEDSWQEWSRHVLMELKRLNHTVEGVDDKLDKMKEDFDDKIERMKEDHITPLKVEIAMLKVKSGMWGLVGGAIPVILMVLIELLKGS